MYSLKTWLESNCKYELIDSVGISLSTLEKYLYGLRLPRLDIALKIEEMTGTTCAEMVEYYELKQGKKPLAKDIDLL